MLHFMDRLCQKKWLGGSVVLGRVTERLSRIMSEHSYTNVWNFFLTGPHVTQAHLELLHYVSQAGLDFIIFLC